MSISERLNPRACADPVAAIPCRSLLDEAKRARWHHETAQGVSDAEHDDLSKVYHHAFSGAFEEPQTDLSGVIDMLDLAEWELRRQVSSEHSLNALGWMALAVAILDLRRIAESRGGGWEQEKGGAK